MAGILLMFPGNVGVKRSENKRSKRSERGENREKRGVRRSRRRFDGPGPVGCCTRNTRPEPSAAIFIIDGANTAIILLLLPGPFIASPGPACRRFSSDAKRWRRGGNGFRAHVKPPWRRGGKHVSTEMETVSRSIRL